MKGRIEILKISQSVDILKCPECGSALVFKINNWDSTILGGLPSKDNDYAKEHYAYYFCPNCPNIKNEFIIVDGRNLYFWLLDEENPKFEGQKERWYNAGTWTLVRP